MTLLVPETLPEFMRTYVPAEPMPTPTPKTTSAATATPIAAAARTGPRVSRTFAVAALAAVAWMGYVVLRLPEVLVALHWPPTWLGLEVGSAVALATAFPEAFRHDRAALPLSVVNAILAAAQTIFVVSTDSVGKGLGGSWPVLAARIVGAFCGVLLAASEPRDRPYRVYCWFRQRLGWLGFGFRPGHQR